MKKLISYMNHFAISLLILICTSCEDEFKSFPIINYSPCEDNSVIIDPNIISDFECQSNYAINEVELVRNPSETPLNKTNALSMPFDLLPTTGDSDEESAAETSPPINFSPFLTLSETAFFSAK